MARWELGRGSFDGIVKMDRCQWDGWRSNDEPGAGWLFSRLTTKRRDQREHEVVVDVAVWERVVRAYVGWEVGYWRD